MGNPPIFAYCYVIANVVKQSSPVAFLTGLLHYIRNDATKSIFDAASFVIENNIDLIK